MIEPSGLASTLGPRQDRMRPPRLVWLALSPSAVMFTIFLLIPVGYAVYLGFTNIQLVGPDSQHFSFTGLQNLHRLAGDANFWHSAQLTIIFLVASGIVGPAVLGMGIALLTRHSPPIIRLGVGATVLLAWILPEVSAGFLWYAFSQSGGTLGHVLGSPNNDFLSASPLLIICIANVWRNTGFAMLIFSAALRAIPHEVEEAAQLERASSTRRLFLVVLPMLRPTIVITLLLLTLGNLAEFTTVFVMTQGGPGQSTMILPIYMYVQAFQFYALGYATAIGLALLLLGGVLSLVYVRDFRSRV